MSIFGGAARRARSGIEEFGLELLGIAGDLFPPGLFFLYTRGIGYELTTLTQEPFPLIGKILIVVSTAFLGVGVLYLVWALLSKKKREEQQPVVGSNRLFWFLNGVAFVGLIIWSNVDPGHRFQTSLLDFTSRAPWFTAHIPSSPELKDRATPVPYTGTGIWKKLAESGSAAELMASLPEGLQGAIMFLWIAFIVLLFATRTLIGKLFAWALIIIMIFVIADSVPKPGGRSPRTGASAGSMTAEASTARACSSEGYAVFNDKEALSSLVAAAQACGNRAKLIIPFGGESQTVDLSSAARCSQDVSAFDKAEVKRVGSDQVKYVPLGRTRSRSAEILLVCS